MAESYEYDLVVIGGGSGGLACAKEAASFGKNVALLDFVKPSPQGSKWGLGGTCVNVGCIPKKLMHQAAILGHDVKDAVEFGWNIHASEMKHDWNKLVQGIQDHIGSLNWNYRVLLRDKEVTYMNAYGSFVDPHTIKTVNKRGKEKVVTTDKVVIATGGRPSYPDIPGAVEYGITSDDLFMLDHAPGKTLVVGASYVALECAGFLAGLGYDVTVLVRSIYLRGFDQQCAEYIANNLIAQGIKVVKPATPSKVVKVGEKLEVTYNGAEIGEVTDSFDTVLFATGRQACTTEIGLDQIGVQLGKNNKIITNEVDQTNVPNVYALGDVLLDKPELTPVAIQAGNFLARRLFDGQTRLCEYENVCTTVFTPLEYSCCGLSEEAAIERHGAANIEVFHSTYTPLEYTIAHRDAAGCYMKLICNKEDNLRVVGIHMLGPNCGEMMQGYGLAIQMGATKENFSRLVGIHPTNAEVLTTLTITKSSGADFAQSGC